MTDRFTRGYDGERHLGERIATVMWNNTHGEADVTLTPLFDGMSEIEKLDALKDAIGLLELEYDILLVEYRERWTANRIAAGKPL